MNISGLSKAKVLAALYNRAQAQGMGLLRYNPTPMTEAMATQVITERGDDPAADFVVSLGGQGRLYFDYVGGRVMKIDITDDEVETDQYNRSNGPNAAEETVAALRAMDEVNPPSVQIAHQRMMREALAELQR